MWAHMGFQLGLSALKHGTSFIAGMQQAKAKRAWQAYNNAMTRIADGQNQNAITTNRNMAIERSTVQGFEIDKSEYLTKAKAEVAAAASDTAGRSVNQTLFAIEHNAAVAQSRRKSDLDAQLVSFENQRRTSAFQAAQQIDYTYIPKPSSVTAMLGFGADYLRISNQWNDTD